MEREAPREPVDGQVGGEINLFVAKHKQTVLVLFEKREYNIYLI